VKSFPSAKDLPGNLREHVRQLLLAIADTKLLLGFHYAEWTFGTPALEASIAACSMSQDEFGHVRLLHACLNAQFGMHPNAMIETRPAAGFAAVTVLNLPQKTWAETVAANLIVDGAVAVLLSGLRGSSFEPVANFIDKMIEEEKHHLRHGQGWFRTLAARSPETMSALRAAGDKALRSTLEWLGPDQQAMATELVSAGILNATWRELRRQFIDWIGSVSDGGGVALGVTKENNSYRLADEMDFGGWLPQNRRCANPVASGLSPVVNEQILYHLRGS
jgi:ring-1,2-phenylacetyl-CoA epoxidase subunit PaaC